jgi:diguanylate cyclase (GGDEF)-like protein/PAS domain S-box-containing protein
MKLLWNAFSKQLTRLFSILNSGKVEELEKKNLLLGLHRLKYLSIILVILFPGFVYADYILLKDISNTPFLRVLKLIHLVSFILSFVYLMIYNRLIRNASSQNSNLSEIILKVYIFLSIFLPTLASVNSQRLTGNIYAYGIALVFAAVAFPFQPIFMLFVYCTNYFFLIFGGYVIGKGAYTTITNNINSTSTVISAFFLFLIFYKYRIEDFINKHRLETSENNFKKLFFKNPLPMIIISMKDGVIVEANKRALEYCDISVGDLGRLNIMELYDNMEDIRLVFEELQKIENMGNHVVEIKTLAGEHRWVICSYEFIEYMNEQSLLIGVTDITESKKMEQELLSHSSTDALTGVLNRRIGLQIVEKELLKARKESKRFIICFVDVDDLKKVNDKYGHNEGDTLISAICNTIADEIGDGDILFRYGGDEFVILFRDKDLSDVNIICHRIKDKYHSMNKDNYKTYNISASFGLFEYKSGMDYNINDIIKLADEEMYHDKLRMKE